MRRQKGLLNGIFMLLIFYGVFNCSCTTPEDRARQIQKKTATQTHVILIQQKKIVPAEITVNKGDTVTWINKDIVDHNITEELNKLWTSGTLSAEKSWSMVVMKSADYFCTIHPVMKGRLIVK
ncbi:cupredoxin domain-containing protein [Flavitalea sp.]|nr:cupredoxin domain-containing protein [Flavitalea sp.]